VRNIRSSVKTDNYSYVTGEIMRLRDVKMPLDQSGEPNEITPLREKWTEYMRTHKDMSDLIWEYVDLIHMWELCLKWKSPKTVELTPMALEAVAELDEALRSITESK
jgi:hypothetical protein